jgi:2'-hydroxyisoflavone reductase
MHLLVLGGGGFLGHAVVTQALDAGHDVTVFSRQGKAPVDGVEAVQGDRTGDLSVLRGRTFDAVLDTFSDPDAVAATAQLLDGAVGAYGYISGMSVYAPDGPRVPDETAPVRVEGRYDDTLQERSVAKLACEAALREHFSGPTLVTRVGIMVGPRDPTDRFTWWPVRLSRALAGRADRRILAPGDPDRPVQYTDVRDLARWMNGMLADGRGGLFNGVGPGRADRVGDVLDACLRAVGGFPGDVEFVWAGEGRMRAALAESVPDEEQRPLWFPEDQIPQDAIDSGAAIAAGLTFRPAEQTAVEVAEWVTSRSEAELAAGFTPELEASLIGLATPSSGVRRP